jgi:hypothetical protein
MFPHLSRTPVSRSFAVGFDAKCGTGEQRLQGSPDQGSGLFGWFKSQGKGYQAHQHDFAALLPDPSQGRLVIACEDALAEFELANSFSAANAGPPTSPPEARQMPGTM